LHYSKYTGLRQEAHAVVYIWIILVFAGWTVLYCAAAVFWRTVSWTRQ
jgi:hypothetical protein